MRLSEEINIEIEAYILEKLKDIQNFSIFEIWFYSEKEGLTFIQKNDCEGVKYFFKRVCLNNMLYEVETRNVYRVLAYNEDEEKKIAGTTLDFKDL